MSTASAVIPVGYKQTEIGVIPVDWIIGSLIGTCDYVDYRGRTPPKSDRGRVLVTSRNIRRGRIDYERSKEYISELTYLEYMKRGIPIVGDVLITTEAPLGMVAQVDDDTIALAQRVIKYRPKDTDLYSKFLMYFLLSNSFQDQLKINTIGSTASGIKGSILHRLVITYPSNIDEQHVISEALYDIDCQLESLKNLISKKRDIKQSVMQELLTGKTRLPGFNGKWKNYNLIDVAKIISGINKPASEMGQGALYLTVKELYVGNYIDTKLLGRIRVSENEIDSKSLVLGDVIFGKSSVKREGIAYPNYFSGCSEPVIFSGFTFCARSNKSLIHARFLFYVLRFKRTRNWVINNSQASALTNLNQSIARQIPITMPVEKDEQEAIAEVLSDMDAEIAALEERLEKAEAIKQGMMQQLLTGKIRIVN